MLDTGNGSVLRRSSSSLASETALVAALTVTLSPVVSDNEAACVSLLSWSSLGLRTWYLRKSIW
jgi:hypothetical protein